MHPTGRCGIRHLKLLEYIPIRASPAYWQPEPEHHGFISSRATLTPKVKPPPGRPSTVSTRIDSDFSLTIMSSTHRLPGQHDSTLRGTMIKLYGLDTYAVEPPRDRKAKGIIVIIPDAFGLDSLNNRYLADTYATKGDYKVYLPDFMRGQCLCQSLSQCHVLTTTTRSLVPELVLGHHESSFRTR